MILKNIFTSELLLYMLVGGIATLIDTSIFGMLVYYFFYDYRYAMIYAFIVGVFINFILCDAYIFDRGDNSFINACLRHYGANLTGLALNQLGMIILVTFFHFQHLILGRMIVAACTFIINFLLIKWFVFEHDSQEC